MIARLVQPCLQQRLGTTVIIENRAGASGSVGTATVAKSPPDGGTWLLVFDNHAANPFVLPDLPYDTEKDLDPVLFIGTAPYVVSTQAQKPFKTLADVIAAAKAKPGAVSYASVGSGSVGHLAMALLVEAGGRAARPRAVSRRRAGHERRRGRPRRSPGRQHRAFHSANSGRHHPGRGANRHGAYARRSAQCRRWARAAFPGSRPMPGGACSRPRARPRPSSAASAPSVTACVREERVARQLTDTQQVSLVLGGPEELRKFVGDQMRVWGAVAREQDIKAD